MTDADTPRVPDFRWIATHGLFMPSDDEWIQITDSTGWPLPLWLDWHRLPSDAVKLGDVEKLRADLAAAERFMNLDRAQAARATADRDKLREQLREAVAHHGVELGKAWRRTEQLRADIRAVLVDFGQLGEPGKPNQTTALEALERIEACLDREPGREEPHRVILNNDCTITEHLPDCPACIGKTPPKPAPAPREEPHCICFVTPESQWTTHYGATEPGSQMEPNPDCPAHGHVVEHQPDTEEADR
ncbi:hypothetical protein L3Q65_46005 [Amycolatopsis sp. FU40]|uniref:hypothetical protein n=1 Tax=Amycolatopsis sp. FU40 TaxID=2914159 RepID=UPI001F29687E|nr:hypothetical protein [Amycolatopsis sp. FU40]UKD55129.1 hypothetical protein L3Q65_46005 [Amycolatopsis sp. FU40]